jgi:PTH1 family peptidyl-tRNA hydrolase
MAISLIVGLGNPDKEYEEHRHNVGFWFVDKLAQDFKVEKKFFGVLGYFKNTRLLKPMTFMNRSGLSVQALANFYKIKPEEILVVHDELDLSAGIVRLKKGGGHGGHNGLRDIISALGSSDFYRLRLGIGHPGDRNLVSNFVLHKPSAIEKTQIEDAMTKATLDIETIIAGNFDKAMQTLHTD